MVSAAGDAAGSFRRLLRPWYVRGVLVVAGLALIVVVLNVMPTIHDPTEGVFPVAVVNSLGRTIELRMCSDDACHSTVDRHTLLDGASFDQNLGPDASIPFKVNDARGASLGCWLLPARSDTGHYSASISSLVPCSSLR